MDLGKEHIRDIARIFPDLMEEVAEETKKQIALRGLKLTGKLIKSVEVKVRASSSQIIGEILIEHYGTILESGVKASRIPFTPGRRSGRRVSKYIQSLIGYFKSRGLPDREAKSAAFATANVHSREGMPTRASRRFSRAKGGERTGFLARTVENTEDYVVSALLDKAADLLILRITQNTAQIEKIIL